MNERKHETDRGKRASFDRRTGAVAGSGAGTGESPDSTEDYDSDLHSEPGAAKGADRTPPSS